MVVAMGRLLVPNIPFTEAGTRRLIDAIYGESDLDRPLIVPSALWAVVEDLKRPLTGRLSMTDVIQMRAEGKMTLRAIGATVGLSPERVRQIEHRALLNLRHPSRRRLYTTHWEVGA